MKRKKVVRAELFLLAVVTLLLVFRALQGPPEPEGVVVLSDIDAERLLRQAFEIDRPTRVTIEAVGSFESSDEGEHNLAAYGWILDRAERSIAWRMDPEHVLRERGSIASIQDTVLLEAGTYDAFFTSYGNQTGSRFGISFLDRLLGNESAWRGDDDRWQMVVRIAPGEVGEINRLDDEDDSAAAPKPSNLVWTTAPMQGGREAEYVFQVSDSAELSIYAIGELGSRPMDYGWIENVTSEERIWEMTLENTEHAGGWDVNRVFRDSMAVESGIYRATYRTDPRQSWNDWVGNPPFDPAAWGLTIAATPLDAVAPFDPLVSREPLIELTMVRDSERRQAQFRVNAPTRFAAYAVGELSQSNRYDWGWLRNNDSQELVWEMLYPRTQQSGDDDSNRSELAFFRLEPGTYTLGYESDDSHSYDSWLHGRPEHPARWGVTLFPVAEQLDSTVVEILDVETTDLARERGHPEPPASPEHPEIVAPMPGNEIASHSGIGNEAQVSSTFSLEQESTLHIRAMGEITISGRYDYGWIEDAETGEIVWEMTVQNTHPAGGADRNRRFDGTLTLEPGEYVVHYRTDFSHAFGDFGDEAPADPHGWGVRISRL